MDDSSSNVRQGKTARRIQRACKPCRIAKAKCDRKLPVCGQCFKRSRDSACEYTEKGLRYNAAAETTSSMNEKVKQLEKLINGLKDRQPQAEMCTSETEDGQKIDLHEVRELATQTGKLKVGESGSTQWIGPSNWESVIDDIADLKAYFEQEQIDSSPEPWTQRTKSSDSIPKANILFATVQSLSQGDLLHHMPQRSEMDRYVAFWFNIMDPTRVIVHAPTFQQQYERFWLNPAAATPAWLAMLLSTSSLGAEISGQALNDAVTLDRADSLRNLTSHALILADPTKPQPWLIECLILHIVCLLFQQHDANPSIWHLMGLTMRLCHQAGYHRDPSKNAKFSRFSCEMRRRVWMVACELDISISNTLGMVSFVNYKLCDTVSPSNLTEDDFSPDHCASPRPYEECTLVQTEICFARLVRLLGETVVSSHAVTLPSKAEIDDMSERLDRVRDQLPEKLKMKPLDRSFIDTPAQITDRFRLDFAYHKAVCMLYRRFLGMEKFEQEQLRCLNAAQCIVQNSINMLIAAQPGGQLAPVRVLLVRHIHDFTLAAMLFCSQQRRVKSSNSPSIGGKPTADVRSKIVQACELWSQIDIQSPKARVALQVILRCQQETQSRDQVGIIPFDEESSSPGLVPFAAAPFTLDSIIAQTQAQLSVKQPPPKLSQIGQEIPLDASLASTNVLFGDDFSWPWPTYQEQFDFVVDGNAFSNMQN